MEAIINIEGEIVEGSFLDVVTQLKKAQDVTGVTVNITSPGGLVDEGDNIYDYLNSLLVPVTTVARKFCASIATKIFLVGSKRKVENDTVFIIHNPFLDGFTGGAEDLAAASSYMKKEEQKLNSFYAEKTGLPIEAIIPLTKAETSITAQQLIELGFAHEIIESTSNVNVVAYKAIAKINNNNLKLMSDQKEVKTMLQELLAGFKTFAKSFKAKALLELTDTNGVMLSFPELEPDQQPAVGDKVTADDGNYIMTDGVTFVVAGGVLTEIIPVQANELEEENKALKAELEALKAEMAQKTQAMAKFEKQLEKVKAMVIEHNPEDDKRTPEKDDTGKSFKYEPGKISNLKK